MQGTYMQKCWRKLGICRGHWLYAIWMRYYLLPFNIQTTTGTHVSFIFTGYTPIYWGFKISFIFHGHLGSKGINIWIIHVGFFSCSQYFEEITQLHGFSHLPFFGSLKNPWLLVLPSPPLVPWSNILRWSSLMRVFKMELHCFCTGRNLHSLKLT